jgi:hypothetical protein
MGRHEQGPDRRRQRASASPGQVRMTVFQYPGEEEEFIPEVQNDRDLFHIEGSNARISPWIAITRISKSGSTDW